MNSKKNIFIVIVNYRTYKDLSKCLDALSKQKGLNRYDLHTIIVDCAYDKKEVEEIQKSYPHIIFILQDDSYGLSANLNKGFKKAISQGADYILMLTPDIYMKEDVLKKLVEKMEDNKNLGAVTCKTLLPEKPPVIYFVGGSIDPIASSTKHIGYLEEDNGQYDDLMQTEFLNCALVLMRVEAFKKNGFWDPRFYLTYEDTDWTTRLRKNGYDIAVVQDTFAWHDESGTVGKRSMQQEYYMARNQLLYIEKNASLKNKMLAYAFLLKKTMVLLPKVLSTRKKNKDYYVLLGRKDYLFRKFGYKEIKN